LGRKASDAEINVIAASDISLPRLRNVFLNSREFKKSFGVKPAGMVEQTPDRRAMIHLHIPKTAGSSLTRIIAPHFASGTQLPVSDGQLGALAAMPEKERRNASFVLAICHTAWRIFCLKDIATSAFCANLAHGF
jgi:hypothetical protein